MANMKKDILKEVKGELNTAVIMVTDDYGVKEENRKFPKELINIPVRLRKVINYFDYKYDSGYGSQECHDFYIWTKEKVFFIHEYDGSTLMRDVPRNPPKALDLTDVQRKALKVLK